MIVCCAILDKSAFCVRYLLVYMGVWRYYFDAATPNYLFFFMSVLLGLFVYIVFVYNASGYIVHVCGFASVT